MVGMQFMGHPHLGADESRNLARLTCKMIRAGVDLDINSERTNFEVISWKNLYWTFSLSRTVNFKLINYHLFVRNKNHQNIFIFIKR